MSEADAALPATAGEMLRAARERQGIHLAVLAASLKVAQRKLELIEGNRYDELPDATFTRALALSMCRALKIDAEPVLTRLPQAQGHGLDQITPGLNAPFRDRAAAGEGGEWPRALSLPLIGALLLVGAAVFVYAVPTGSWSPTQWLTLLDRPSTGSGPAPVIGAPDVPAATAAVVAPTTAPVEAPLAAAPPPAAEPQGATPTVATSPAVAATPVVETVFSAPASAPPAGGLLTLRASAESWIEVRDRNGQILLSRTLAPGEATGVDGAVPLSLTVGNAEATEVVFRGRPVTLAANRDNVARMELR